MIIMKILVSLPFLSTSWRIAKSFLSEEAFASFFI